MSRTDGLKAYPMETMKTKAPVPTKQTAYDAAVKYRDYGTAKTMNLIDFGEKRKARMSKKGFK